MFVNIILIEEFCASHSYIIINVEMIILRYNDQ